MALQEAMQTIRQGLLTRSGPPVAKGPLRGRESCLLANAFRPLRQPPVHVSAGNSHHGDWRSPSVFESKPVDRERLPRVQ